MSVSDAAIRETASGLANGRPRLAVRSMAVRLKALVRFATRTLSPALAAGIAMVAGSPPAPAQSNPAPVPPSASSSDAHARALQLFSAALETVSAHFLESKDEVTFTQTALKKALAGLDGHSTYMTAAEYRSFDDNAKEKLCGIGVVVELAGERLRVASTIDGGPALRGGVMAGWEIVSIDGATATGLTLAGATGKLRGEPESVVHVGFRTPAGRNVTIELRREMLHIASVYQRRIGDVGYIRVTGFTQISPADFLEAERTLLDGPPLYGLILDLRNNGGGFIDAAVAVVSHFLSAGEIVVRAGPTLPSAQPTLATGGDPAFASLPLVVLVNGGTASAAEIVAAALRDQHRATVVGQPSFGKGVVQTIFPLEGGKIGAVSVTTARYYTPAGSSIHQIGIVPDLMVARTANEARDSVSGLATFSEAAVDHTLANDAGLKRAAVTAIEGPDDAAAPITADRPLFVQSLPSEADIAVDFQIRRALDVLKAGSVDAARRAHPARIYRPPTIAAEHSAISVPALGS